MDEIIFVKIGSPCQTNPTATNKQKMCLPKFPTGHYMSKSVFIYLFIYLFVCLLFIYLFIYYFVEMPIQNMPYLQLTI
jgi:hypothetical protein